MPELNRRVFIGGMIGAAGMPISAARAATSVTVFSADVRPLSIAEGNRRGLVLDIVSEALQRSGYEASYQFSPFAEAMAKTQATPGSLMSPLGRNETREPLFSWVAKILDVPQAMGTRRDKPVLDLAASRSIGRIGVVSGGVQETFLKGEGFANLVGFKTAADIASALIAGDVDAWYGTATEISLVFEELGKAGAVHLGPAIQSVPVWLAGNLDLTGVDVERIAASLDQMAKDGTVERHYRAYVNA